MPRNPVSVSFLFRFRFQAKLSVSFPLPFPMRNETKRNDGKPSDIKAVFAYGRSWEFHNVTCAKCMSTYALQVFFFSIFSRLPPLQSVPYWYFTFNRMDVSTSKCSRNPSDLFQRTKNILIHNGAVAKGSYCLFGYGNANTNVLN